MSLEQLWAGWRSNYVVAPAGDSTAAGGDCVFCRIAAAPAAEDEANLVAWRGGHVLAVLNAYPYAPGHLLVMPLRHAGELEGLTRSESTELWEGTRLAASAAKAAFAPDGLNIGANLGRAGGAGIPSHLHLHVVPRWLGDTNFMTSVASVRVLSEALGDSWSKLRAAWPGEVPEGDGTGSA